MDRTLKPAKRNNKRRGQRNYAAWQRFSPDGETPYPVRGRLCRYCPHDNTEHLMKSGQPHFFRPATATERRDPSAILYIHELPDGGEMLVRRVVVANRAELITAYCLACAESIGTAQALCYQRNPVSSTGQALAVGEVIAIETGNSDIGVAA